ncbi:uncharacterized protein LAJ45_11731 [Morchella importuna]|uniref:uncharacterized protein n=1 Tax=Morchella importuna TaxID=1174673 RepID=UPI001E8E95E0|nr:uncharacterized protein LAJ45_11731 [Morchella importuna]KAH8144298.1 hypothetical protein LAJ45_11731 [Morchella importuna]
MPSFHSYGVHTFLELQDISSDPISKLSRLSESTSKITWSPIQGMTHPILSTNVISPATTGSPLPFCIVVEFDADIDRHSPNHPKGDVRIEVKVDGVVSGWRVLPQAKIWPKGTRIEFSGLRVARTEEMAFIFNSPPRNSGKSKDNLSASTLTSSIEAINTSLPLNTSHIEILITIGKKHNTLEKYLIFSPVLQEAFYIPPVSLSSQWLQHSINVNIQGTKRKLESQQSNRNEGTSAAVPVRPSYRPATIGVSQKTPQMREAEFTARIHLARFWFIIYPGPVHLDLPKEPISSIPLASVGDQDAFKSAEIVVVHKKTDEERTLDNSISKMEASDTVAGRKRKVTKIKTSETNELFPAIPQWQEDGQIRKHEGTISTTPALQGIIPDIQHQKDLNIISKAHFGTGSDDLRRRSSQKQTKVIPNTLASPVGLVGSFVYLHVKFRHNEHVTTKCVSQLFLFPLLHVSR